MANSKVISSIEEAFEIAGGYVEVDDNTFARAMEMVKEHDAEMATLLEESREQELLLREKTKAEQAIDVSAEVLAENTAFLYAKLGNNSLDTELLNDAEIKEAMQNTPIVDTEDGKTYTKLSEEESIKHFNMLIEKAKLDVFCEQSRNADFAKISEEDRDIFLFEEAKMSFLGTLMNLRTASQLEANAEKSANAIKEQKVEFFTEQQLALSSNFFQDKANQFAESNDSNPEIVEISKQSVIEACADSDKKAEKYKNDIIDLASKSKGKKKDALNKAAIWVNKFKTSFTEKASALWRERYEVANIFRDRAPKIITDLAATGTLVGATIASAPWLGSAVAAYGAYKVASSWVWPIVTEARKNARIERKEGKKSKIKFVDQLREASDSIFKNKEKRMAYFKEAGWGSAAGLVGLGAAGVVAGAGSALAAKSAQSLSSMAVHSVNNAINTVSTLKNKNKSTWAKVFTFGGLVAGGAIWYNYFENSELSVSPNAGLNKVVTGDTETVLTDGITNKGAKGVQTVVNDAEKLKATLTNNVAEDVKPAKVNNTVVSVAEGVEKAGGSVVSAPEVWTKESGITENQWAKLQAYWNEDPEKYKEFYAKINDSLLQEGGYFEGMTRDQVLFRYERLSSWNLPGHQDTIEKLDKFFECNEKLELNEDDINVIKSVNSYGGIDNVQGTEDVVVNGRSIDCKDGNSLRVEATEKSSISVEESATSTQTAQGNGISITREKGTINTTLTVNDETKVSINKGNGGTVVGTENYVNGSEVSAVADNKTIMTNAGGEYNTVKVEEVGEAREFGTQVSGTSVKVEETGAAREFGAQVSGASVKVEETGVAKEFGTQDSGASVKVEETGVAREFGAQDSGASVKVEETGVAREFGAQTPQQVETSYQIVEDGDDIKAGTAAAGNVEERGGFENTGITEEQYKDTKNFFKNDDGENLYDFYHDKLAAKPEWFVKGAMFEGLSVEQALYSTATLTKMGYGPLGQFNEQLDTVYNYLNGCSDDITAEQQASIKLFYDRVNGDTTVEGVIGDRAVRTISVEAECSEKVNLNVEQAADGRTEPSGEGLVRLYMHKIEKPIASEPIITRVEGQENIHLTQNVEEKLTINKGNGAMDNDSKVIADNVNANEVNAEAENRTIYTNSTSVETAQNEVKIKEGKVRDFAEANETKGSSKSKKLSGNPEIDKYLGGR